MKLLVDVELSPSDVATIFCEWDEEKQAQFFIECAAVASPWMAWNAIGEHLRDSNDEAIQVIEGIYGGLQS